jgi:uncharacterized membrane protein
MTEQTDVVEVSETGRILAAASHVSVFIGVPLFLLPMITRDDAFALYHARQAALVSIGMLISVLLLVAFSIVTCGFGTIAGPLLMVWYVPAVLGLLDVLGNRQKPIPLIGGFAEQLFSFVELK